MQEMMSGNEHDDLESCFETSSSPTPAHRSRNLEEEEEEEAERVCHGGAFEEQLPAMSAPQGGEGEVRGPAGRVLIRRQSFHEIKGGRLVCRSFTRAAELDEETNAYERPALSQDATEDLRCRWRRHKLKRVGVCGDAFGFRESQRDFYEAVRRSGDAPATPTHGSNSGVTTSSGDRTEGELSASHTWKQGSKKAGLAKRLLKKVGSGLKSAAKFPARVRSAG